MMPDAGISVSLSQSPATKFFFVAEAIWVAHICGRPGMNAGLGVQHLHHRLEIPVDVHDLGPLVVPNIACRIRSKALNLPAHRDTCPPSSSTPTASGSGPGELAMSASDPSVSIDGSVPFSIKMPPT
jgi:hypothetical protein